MHHDETTATEDMNFPQELAAAYRKLSKESTEGKPDDAYVFSEIAKLDRQYASDEHYFNSVEGVICNIGAEQGSRKLLHAARTTQTQEGTPSLR